MSAPVPETCESINKVQKLLRRARGEMDNARVCVEREDESGARRDIDDASGYVHDAENELESLRSDNESLREWGTEQEARVQELEQELAENVSEVDRLETLTVNLGIVLRSSALDAEKLATIAAILDGTWTSDPAETINDDNAAGSPAIQGASDE